MLAHVLSGAVLGVEAYTVRVEVDLGRGLPAMNVVGLPESAVREGRERVLAALANSGFKIPSRRITVNLAPADVPKSGSAFDLPAALGILAAAGEIPGAALRGVVAVGELGLDGTVRPVRGMLSIAARSVEDGARALLCPPDNAAEACVAEGLNVVATPTLKDAVAHLRGQRLPSRRGRRARGPAELPPIDLDFRDVKGQEAAKRGLEIAAAGRHNVLMIGPPGAGKSMLARRLGGIMPPLTCDEAIAATRVYSVAGRLRPGQALLEARPFRAPHHSVSDAGLIGGGNPPRPGEASLAHTGVLFLDELPEFRRNALESLRQPLEDGYVQIGRAGVSLCYPARFTLIAAMNPCPCGFHAPETQRCTCTPGQVDRYMARVSGPLLDRIDMHINVLPLSGDTLTTAATGESSALVRERVLEARARQALRHTRRPDVSRMEIPANADMGARELRRYCRLDEGGELILRRAVNQLGFSARGFHRVLRVARTIADLAGSDRITPDHVAEAVQFRFLDRSRAA